MNKKLIWGAALLLNLCFLVFISCNDDDDNNPSKPSIDLRELGAENEKTAIIGSDLHIEANITAEGAIARIDVEIHQENGEYKIEKSYTEGYSGLKNKLFHEHIDIPDETPAGEYHLHLTVTDQFGQTETAESELTIKEPSVSISIDNFTFGAGHDFPDNRIGYIGTAPVVEATSIKTQNGIDKIYVMLHSEGSTADFELDTTFTYDGGTELTDFHKHISIPDDAPAGDYHLHFKVYDKKGKTLEKSMDIEIKETGITVSDLDIGNETEFKVTATDPLKSILVRIYKADAPAGTYSYTDTFTDDFASGDVKEYTFHKHLDATATGTAAGEYVIEIRISDNKGAYKTIKDTLTIN
jgi:hypothetical protein